MKTNFISVAIPLLLAFALANITLRLPLIKIILLILTLSSAAHASNIEQAFKSKDYKTVTKIYLQSPKRKWTYSEMIRISYSLRKNNQYRQSIRLSLKILNDRFKKKHQEVIRKVRKAEMLDPEEYPKRHEDSLLEHISGLLSYNQTR